MELFYGQAQENSMHYDIKIPCKVSLHENLPSKVQYYAAFLILCDLVIFCDRPLTGTFGLSDTLFIFIVLSSEPI